jgi:EAL domain-containing protein (putative c-di-GMP-specific phosphodiesterase class I)/GGDEF domain-containing protein
MSDTLRQLREHDPVTDCMTIGALREQAEREIADYEQQKIPLVFYTIEIEKFGTGIHLLGQSSFEELLQTVVARIRRQLPKLHFLARRGDHSFVAVARFDTESQDGPSSASGIIQVLNDPIVTGRYEYFIAASVGYSSFPRDGGTLDEMLYNSDIAAMASARQRHNLALAFSPSMASEANERVRIETALHRAVDHEEFQLAYQPKVDLATGKVTGVEALIRWPGRNNMSPAKFIPIAEECGLISFIGEWALRQSCKVTMQWKRAGHHIPISVNVSTRQFQDSDFHDIVEEILKETGCEPALIELEVTEGVMIRDPEAAIEIFNKLKSLGLKISIDDFGMGFSSLSYLKNLPVDKLKIDRAFVAGLPHEKDNEAITIAIIAMAGAMGLRTVAEGVEDIECLEHLRAMGCDEIQGFYFSKPLFEKEFLSWLYAYESVRKFGKFIEPVLQISL